MSRFKKTDCLAFGLAIFAMFFGAGNIIFPLALGQLALDKTPWQLLGFLFTAVFIPFLGLVALFRSGGKVQGFFAPLGKILGLVVAMIVISLLGPFGAAPRCILLMHSTLSLCFSSLPLMTFSFISCLVIFFFSFRENRLVKWLGYVLSPLMLIFLLFVMLKGFICAPEVLMHSTDGSHAQHVWKGLIEGYNTMDLLAACFFAPIVISSLSQEQSKKDLNRFVLSASLIGAVLLALVYIGFSYLAYYHASMLAGTSKEELLGKIAIIVLGPKASIIVGLTVVFACLTTAIALIAAFANFVQKELLLKKMSYKSTLAISLAITFFVTTLEFQGVASLLGPLLKFFYPGLILLTLYNLIKPVALELKAS
ncbi:MAG: branched-chain amino acid transporter [Chlamydiae bacterium]|nr:branched-chain amino acid transporter [Chlamydiota bacterium]